MATKRTRRARNRRAEIDPEIVAFLKDDEGAKFPYFTTDEEIRTTWEQIREEFIARWAEQRPGTRPTAWWRFDASEPRRRVGGTGQAAFEVLADVEAYEMGIPISWVEPWHVDLYGPHFAGKPIDPSDPPAFEAQSTYIRRLGLLLPGELDRLSPADFEPEFIEAAVDPDEDEAA